ncbi:UvrD-helicase domain-containing protein [Corynebacterium sp. 3HC-13]|uniref:UvrD-helicase domain-containing protein n=1 Tax=Corynebacterium poyangense TaxID=2684405 RepID=UPI001CC9EF7A|nr:UvrD-helicase domain-containing protein [Corynebacterium poyangense]MBZ8177319.1 UvrD-helicase domain-containing protein [Corynebacterium poyangense]
MSKETSDFSHYTIIEASAGSGKTYAITTELSRLISQGVDPSRVIATTFTKAAAADLERRIGERLLSDGFDTQARQLPAALMGTVNSITDTIVRRFALDSGISPDIAVLDEVSESTLFHAACAGIIAQAMQDHRPLLRRCGYGIDVSNSRYTKTVAHDWNAVIEDMISLLRANRISGESKDKLIEKSQQLVEDALKLAIPTARREQWGTSRDIDEQLAQAYEDVLVQAENGTLNKRTAAVVLSDEKAYRRVIENLRDKPREKYSWPELLNIQQIKVSQLPGAKKTMGAPVQKIIREHFAPSDFEANHNVKVASPYLGTAEFISDMKEIIALTFETAFSCLEAYEAAKSAAGLIDFTDQEARTLDLLLEKPEVRDWIQESYDILVVDEFQDTNPMQLALFLEIGKLVDQVIWVGDTKQSIYGFRGSDPVLMNEAARTINSRLDHTQVSRNILSDSWRTDGVPLRFSNEYFKRVFDNTENVILNIPEQRKEQNPDIEESGRLEFWEFTKVGDIPAIVAEGISQLRKEGEEGSIAVLTRQGDTGVEILQELKRQGIPATGPDMPVEENLEVLLLLAGLRWVVDQHDTAALMEIITLWPQHPAHRSWFSALADVADKAERRALLREWAQDPCFSTLSDVADNSARLSPKQAVQQVIDALDLRGYLSTLSNPESRYGALLGCVEAAEQWEDRHSSQGLPATASGFVSDITESGNFPTAKPARGPGNIVVSTMHKAKGLEWNTVITVLKNSGKRYLNSVWLEPAQSFDFDHPLHGREIRFLPATPLIQKNVEQSGKGVDVGAFYYEQLWDPELHPENFARRQADQDEEDRIRYVALTRSKTCTILCTSADGEALTTPRVEVEFGPDFLKLSSQKFGLDIVPVHKRVCSSEDEEKPDAVLPAPSPLPAWREEPQRPDNPIYSRFQPSRITLEAEQLAEVEVRTKASLGEPIPTAGGKVRADWLGEAVHSYLATPFAALSHAQQEALASEIVDRWKVAHHLSAEQLVSIGNRFSQWLATEYPDARIITEVPVRIRTEEGQVAQGWIDLLIEQPDGSLAVVDHKTYAGDNAEDHVRRKFAGQLLSYADAIEAVHQRRPEEIMIHLPLIGTMLSLKG